MSLPPAPHILLMRPLHLAHSSWLMLRLWMQSPVARRRMFQQQLVSFSSLVLIMRPSGIQEVGKNPFIHKWNLMLLAITLLSF